MYARYFPFGSGGMLSTVCGSDTAGSKTFENGGVSCDDFERLAICARKRQLPVPTMSRRPFAVVEPKPLTLKSETLPTPSRATGFRAGGATTTGATGATLGAIFGGSP